MCGGHLPTQNTFFNNIKLRDKIKKVHALIIGGSAGAMNLAENVYCIPELEGEALDPNFNGEAYILKNGIIEKINEDNQLTIIN